jgi:GNAT superfamily N-acetyltransferase
MLWEDVAVDKDRFTAICDEDRYAALEGAEILHLVTAREGETLAGFFLMFITPNAHYKGAGFMAFTDMYFIKPEYRHGNVGVNLFLFMEQTLKEKGVVKAYSSHKLHRDRGPLFEYLGWKPTDLVYSKVL